MVRASFHLPGIVSPKIFLLVQEESHGWRLTVSQWIQIEEEPLGGHALADKGQNRFWAVFQ